MTVANLIRLLLGVFLLAVGVSFLGYTVLLFQGFSSELRPISAGGALLLLLTIFSVMVAHANNMVIADKILDNVVVGVSLPLILIAHHRTVFITAILGLVLLLASYRHKAFFVIKTGAASVILVAVLCVAFMIVPRFEHIFMKALAGIADPYSDITASWRLEGWQKQLAALSERQVLFGKGLGSYYDWDVGNWRYSNVRVKVGPHEAYVEVVLKLGLLGLAVYLLLAYSFFRKMLVARKKLKPGSAKAYIDMSLVTFGAAHVFMTGYGFSLITLVSYAIGITAVRLLQD